jgi:pyruvate dehydrogenase E2 component (dihydrolipoamide acetyltransferase)
MHEILLPKMGQSVEEAEIVEWLKQEGDAVEEGAPLFTIQTDKAEVECESTASGVLRKILVEAGVEVPVMTVVALVGEAGEALPDLSKYGAGGGGEEAAPAPAPAESPDAAPEPEAVQAPAAQPAPAAGGEAPVSPRAKKAAAAKGIDASRLQGSGAGGRVMEADVLSQGDVKITPTAKRMAQNTGMDVSGVQGTGVGGKITKDDISAAASGGPKTPAGPAAAPAVAPSGAGEVTPLTPMRRIIATRMAESKYSAPHYYVTIEIDMGAAKAFRAGLKAFKASYNDLVLAAVVKAIREYPQVNAKWCGDSIEVLSDINLGMAVAIDAGLIVPVIRQAQNLSLEGLCSATKAMAVKARDNKLLPDDYTGNTFTVSNLGVFGVDSFTAIINQPDSAILAIGGMKDKPVVIDGGIHIRPMMKITMSSDHRVIDGAVAAQFMGRLREIMEAGEF